MDYNMNALMGQNITDEDYAKEFGVPREYIGTPRINEFMLDRQMGIDQSYYEDKGMSKQKAREKAQSNRREVEGRIKSLMDLQHK